jgi:hypothetical protein
MTLSDATSKNFENEQLVCAIAIAIAIASQM